MSRRARAATAAVLLCLLVPASPAGADGEAPIDVVDLGGVPVDGSTDTQDPTELTAGIWSDTLGPAQPKAPHFYTYERTMADSTVHVGVTGANTVVNDGLSVAVTTSAGEDCATDDSTSGFSNPFGTFGAGVSAGPDVPDGRDSPCLTADVLRIEVGRGTATTTNDLAIALRIVEEAPVLRGAADLPAPPETPRVGAPQVEESGESTGATSFEEAPYLDPGSYATTVAEGEERLWRVRLDWGQQLSVRLDVPAQDDAARRALEATSTTPEVVLVQTDPMLDSFPDAVEDSESSGGYDSEEPSVLTDGSPPVAYLNRFDGDPPLLPGDYWVTVSVSAPDEGRAPLDVPMALAVDVVGEGEGRPDYPGTVTSPAGNDGPEGYDPATPFLVGEGQFSADVSGTPTVPDDEAATAGDTSGRRTAGLVVGGLSLLSVAAGVVLLRRRVTRAAAR